MTLPVFDSAKHHIGLAPVGDPLQGLVLAGGYTRVPQRYGNSPKYGSAEDQLDVASLSRYSQDDFSGGGYQERFRDDEAMLMRSKNFLPHQVDDSARTIPPLLWWASAGVRNIPTLYKAEAGGASGGAMAATGIVKLVDIFPTGNKILLTDTDKFRFYSVADGSLVESTDPDWEIQGVCHDPADNKVYAVVKKPSDSSFALKQINPADGSKVTVKVFAAAVQGPCRGMIATSGRDVLISMGDTLYLADVNDARDDATITRIGRLPGRWRDALSYNGMTYLLLTDYAQKTSIHQWDGTQLLPVTDVPDNFIGNCIGVYGGRLYVGGTALDTAGTEKYAEIYEITGSSLRLLKTFGSESRAGEDCPTTIYDMTVFEGLAFFATDKSYLIAYDLTRDALWPEIEVQQVEGGSVDCLAVFSTRQRLFVYGYDHDRTTPKDGFYRLAVADADMTSLGANGPGVDVTGNSVIETSEFSPEPDREKKWSQLRVVSRYSPAPTLEVSQDGGDTWSAVAASSSSGTKFITTDFDLSTLATSEGIRFRFTFAKTTTRYSEMVAFTCSFLMLDSGKQAWSFSILGAANPELLDGTYPEQDVDSLRSTLWGYWENKTTLTYRDRDGTERTVFVSDLQETDPVMGEALDDAGTVFEGFFSVTLTEL